MVISNLTPLAYEPPALRNSHTIRLSVPMQTLDFDAVLVYFA